MKLSANTDQLTIKFQGFEIIWGVKSKLILERSEVTNVEWRPGKLDPESYKGWRCPGTSIPGVFLAGSFAHNGRWQFWCVYLNRPGEIVITTNKKRYRKIRISANEAMAQFALDWWENAK